MLDGSKIRQLRLNHGMTCSDLSNLSKKFDVHISKSYLEELERGSKDNPSFNIIETIATILRVNIDDLRVS